MKTKKILLNGILALAATTLFFTGCKKEKEDNDTSGSSDNALAEAAFEDMGTITGEAGHWGRVNYRGGKPGDGMFSFCLKGLYFNNKDTSNPDTIIVDFGPTNSKCADDKIRRGKINIIYSGDFTKAGTVVSVQPENYFLNDNQIVGHKTITNNGLVNGNISYTVKVDGQIILANGGGVILWKSDRTWEWQNWSNNGLIGGFNWRDDIHYFSGSSSGRSASGHTFSSNITKRLVYKLSCPKHIVEGTFDFTPHNKPTRVVDFGNGACDNIATVTVNGKTYTIHLR